MNINRIQFLLNLINLELERIEKEILEILDYVQLEILLEESLTMLEIVEDIEEQIQLLLIKQN